MPTDTERNKLKAAGNFMILLKKYTAIPIIVVARAVFVRLPIGKSQGNCFPELIVISKKQAA